MHQIGIAVDLAAGKSGGEWLFGSPSTRTDAAVFDMGENGALSGQSCAQTVRIVGMDDGPSGLSRAHAKIIAAAGPPSNTQDIKAAASLAKQGQESTAILGRLPRHAQYPGQHAFLRVQAVLGLVEHHRLRAVDDVFSHFLAAMRRQAVHEDRVLGGLCHQLRW